MYIPHDAKNVVILVSGGIDSTLLLYLLAKEVSQNKLDVQLNAVSSRIGMINPERVRKVIQYIEQIYSTEIQYNHSAQHGWIRDIVSEVFMVCQPDYVYTGCNLVVTDKFTPTKYIKNDTPPHRGEALNERHLRPFITYDKIKIVDLYIQNNLLDLLRITYSCGFSQVEECGECYFCTEKIWATKTLNIHKLFNYTNNIHNV